jgi:hypothetical protein
LDCEVLPSSRRAPWQILQDYIQDDAERQQVRQRLLTDLDETTEWNYV